MLDAAFVIDQHQGRQGWTDGTVLDLLIEYIDNQQSGDALDDFLRQKADEENNA